MTIRFVLQNRTKFLGLLPREFWGFFCREPNFACLDLNKKSYHKNVTIALQAFSCLQAVSRCLTPALMFLDSKFNVLKLLFYCILAIWGPGNFIDYVFKYHIVCITNISTNRVNRVIFWPQMLYSTSPDTAHSFTTRLQEATLNFRWTWYREITRRNGFIRISSTLYSQALYRITLNTSSGVSKHSP